MRNSFGVRPERLLCHNDPDRLVSECNVAGTDRRTGRYKSADVILRRDVARRPLIRCIVSPKPGKHNGGALSIIQARVAVPTGKQGARESGQQIGFKAEEPRRFPPLWSGY